MAVRLDRTEFAAVVFDMDGVITDTARVHAAAWKRMFDDFLASRAGPGFTPFSGDDYLRYVDGRPRDAGVAGFLAARGIDLPPGAPGDAPERETVWGLANRKNADFLRVLGEHGVDAFPSSVSLVRELQRKRFGTAVISASRNAQRILEAAGIGELFPVRVDGVELERLGLPGKPDPAVFVEAARRLDARPAEAVVVEDAVAGVEAGAAGGFGLVIGVDRVGHADELLAHGAHVVVRDLGEISCQ